ncbi:hypothetical protein CDL12_23516 [Handroanthus impetiginosus]|uniref:Uncharacterized protein n=1 Tax=Handroanthus impetiginosus TaxID=429701 RepID=A0A2G9GF89_9LAMI|nr:hypothetical protein CDL12_23516 [Handroanthus impetiginosus]
MEDTETLGLLLEETNLIDDSATAIDLNLFVGSPINDSTTLLAKLLSDRDINVSAFKSIIMKVWILDTEFKSTEFWIKVFKLLIKFHNADVVKLIRNSIGKFIRFDSSKSCYKWKAFLRIKIEIELHKPLLDSLTLNLSPSYSTIIDIRYKKLHDHYFSCGRFGHKRTSYTFFNQLYPSPLKNPCLDRESPLFKVSMLNSGPKLQAISTFTLKLLDPLHYQTPSFPLPNRR